MTNNIQHWTQSYHQPALFDTGELLLRLNQPVELALAIGLQHNPENLAKLAHAASAAAFAEVGDAYMTPHIRSAVSSAARMALGLKAFPKATPVVQFDPSLAAELADTLDVAVDRELSNTYHQLQLDNSQAGVL